MKDSKLVDDAVYLSRQVKMLMYGDITVQIPIKLFMDSEPALESIASSRHVEGKLLRMKAKKLKDKCLEGEVLSYA